MKNSVRVNEQTWLTVLYFDPDAEPGEHKFTWETVGFYGDYIVQSDVKPHVATFTAPPVPGDYIVRVTVADKFGKTDSGLVTIFVR